MPKNHQLIQVAHIKCHLLELIDGSWAYVGTGEIKPSVGVRQCGQSF